MAEPAHSDSSMQTAIWGAVLGALAWLVLRFIGLWDKGNEKQDTEIKELRQESALLRKEYEVTARHVLHLRIHLKLAKPSDVFKVAPPPEESSA